MHGFGVPRTTHTLSCAEIVRTAVVHRRFRTPLKAVRQGSGKKFSCRARKIVLLDRKVIAFRGPIIGISVAFSRSPPR
jgi:hypothetical protein